ncbi:hypothetical protein RE9425_45840 [Prescottella equi]|nr:hypothetical protein RE9425_45840 [Prescottella equi]
MGVASVAAADVELAAGGDQLVEQHDDNVRLRHGEYARHGVWGRDRSCGCAHAQKLVNLFTNLGRGPAAVTIAAALLSRRR